MESSSESSSRSNSLPNSRPTSPGVSSLRLLKTNLKDNSITLDKVVLKETHVLKRFTITNLVPFTVKVAFTLNDLSTEQIKFQIENENLRDDKRDELDPIQADHFNQVTPYSIGNEF